MRPLRLGTRKSRLALVQSQRVADAIAALDPSLRVDLVAVITAGDRDQRTPLPAIGGKGLFTQELEDGLLGGRIDLAVHSLKDLPTDLPPGLVLGAVLARESPFDALLARVAPNLAALPAGARVGTSSLRRQAQLRRLRPDVRLEEVRGNVDSRVRKLREGALDGLVLAAAGLERLGLEAEIREILPPEAVMPAVGQGALAVEIRASDDATAAVVARLEDAATRAAVTAERAFLARLGGGCSTPVGALGLLETGRLRLQGVVVAPDGSECVRGERTGRPGEAEALGRGLADELLAAGASRLLGGGSA